MLEFAKEVPKLKEQIINHINKNHLPGDNSFDYGDFEEAINYTFKLLGIEIMDRYCADLNCDYQGDQLWLYVLSTGWYSESCVVATIWGYGSCSGCDAIYACNSSEDLYYNVLEFFEMMRCFIDENSNWSKDIETEQCEFKRKSSDD